MSFSSTFALHIRSSKTLTVAEGYTVCRRSLLLALARTLIDPQPGNENEVGQGIRDSGVPRQEIFLTSKLWNTHHPNVQEGLQQSLDALGVDYLDLYVSPSVELLRLPSSVQILTLGALVNPLACSPSASKFLVPWTYA